MSNFVINKKGLSQENNYQDEYFAVISDALAKIGLINVKSFELLIVIYLNLLIQLDYLTIFGLEPKTEKLNGLFYV